MPDRPRRPTSVPPGADAALEIAARFLATRPRSRWEVERRLRRAGAGNGVVTAVLERLTRLGYVDDAAFVRYWQEQRDRHAPRGQRLIEAELRQRGVPSETIRAQPSDVRRADDDLVAQGDAERARIALAQHLRGRPLPRDLRELQRLAAYLMRRGFDGATARRTLRSAGAAELTEST